MKLKNILYATVLLISTLALSGCWLDTPSDGADEPTDVPIVVATAPILAVPVKGAGTVTLTWSQPDSSPLGGYDVLADGAVNASIDGLSTVITIDTVLAHCFIIDAKYTSTGQVLSSNQVCTEPDPIFDGTTISGYSLYLGDTSAVTWVADIGLSDESPNCLIEYAGIRPNARLYFGIVARDAAGERMNADVSLSGYRLQLGIADDALNTAYSLTSGPSKVYWTENMNAGIYYGAASAIDINGQLGPKSNCIQLEIEAPVL